MRNKFAKVSDPNKFETCPGEKYHVTYEPVVNPDGTITLVESGKEDIQALIDSYLDTTDIAYIIKRLEMGDTSVLNQKQPMYGDFTEVPKTYAEALQLVIDAENSFYKLPLDTRNKFDNDYKQWLAQAGTMEWSERMGFVKDQDTEPVVNDSNEVKE